MFRAKKDVICALLINLDPDIRRSDPALMQCLFPFLLLLLISVDWNPWPCHITLAPISWLNVASGTSVSFWSKSRNPHVLSEIPWRGRELRRLARISKALLMPSDNYLHREVMILTAMSPDDTESLPLRSISAWRFRQMRQNLWCTWCGCTFLDLSWHSSHIRSSVQVPLEFHLARNNLKPWSFICCWCWLWILKK